MPTRFVISVLILLLMFVSPHVVLAEKTVHLAMEIDYGVKIFSSAPPVPAVGKTEELFSILSGSSDFPLHAALIRDFVSHTVEGSRDITAIKEELRRLHDQALLRFNPAKPGTVFDKALITLFLATYNYSDLPSRHYALQSLNDFSLLLVLDPGQSWFHLFYTVGYASLASVDGVDVSDYRGHDPLVELRRSLTMENRDPWFHYVAGQTFLTLSADSPDIHQLAFGEFSAARKLAPDNAALQESIHRILVEMLGNYDSRKQEKPFWLEESVYSEVLRREPDNPAAMNNLAFLYGRFDHNLTYAVELARKAWTLMPAQGAFLDTLGFVLIKTGDLKEGTERLLEAYRLSPEDEDNRRHLCDLYLMQNDNESVLPHLEWLLAREPKSDMLSNNLAYTLSELNRELDRALKLVNSALELQPDSPVYLDTKGWILFKLGMPDQGRALIEQAIVKEPGIGALRIHLGDIAFFQGNLDLALEHYLIGLRLEPSFPNGAEWLGKLSAIRELEKLALKNGQQLDWRIGMKTPFRYELYDEVLELIRQEFSRSLKKR